MGKEKIGLALSGGGLFGLGHIGVLENLEEAGINPSFIVGSSIGAVVGALYADSGIIGVRRLLEKIENERVFSPKELLRNPSPSRFFERLTNVIESLLSVRLINDLPTKFASIATDAATGEKVVLGHGEIIPALRATTSYPGVFRSQILDGRALIDGGVSEYLPSQTLKECGAELLIGSGIDLISTIPTDVAYGLNRLNLGVRSLQILQNNLLKHEQKLCDIVVNLEYSPSDWYRFDRVNLIIEQGKKQSKEPIERIRSMLKTKR